MQLSYKVVLDTRRPKKDETYPLTLRVYDGPSYKAMGLKIAVKDSDWNDVAQVVKSSHPLCNTLNSHLADLKAKVQKLILQAEDSKEGCSPELIIDSLTSKPKAQVKTQVSFTDYANMQVTKLVNSGKVGNSIVYSCAINKLTAYTSKNSFPFEAMTYKFLSDFNDAMLGEGIKVNTISVYFRALRAIYNKAIREGVISTSSYPFANFKIKSERTINRALTLAEMRTIINHPLQKGSSMWHWRNYFLISFCLIGINFADLLTLKKQDIVDGRVTFRRKKTGKVYSIKLQQTTLELFDKYIKEDRQLILPVIKQTSDLVKLKKDITQAIHVCNDNLERLCKMCSVSKNVTTYYARYTWANIAKSLGYSKDLIAEALGHQYGNKVTGIYLDDYENDVIDNANAAVIAAVFK